MMTDKEYRKYQKELLEKRQKKTEEYIRRLMKRLNPPDTEEETDDA